MKYLLLTFSIFSFLLSSGQDKITTEIITVGPYQTHQNYEHFKRFVLNASDNQVEYISGFDYEWGYDYRLKVEKKTLKEEWSDGTRFEYKLIEIISKTQVDKSFGFNIYLDPLVYYHIESGEGFTEDNIAIKVRSKNLFSYMDEIEILVPDELLEEFEKIRNGENGRVGKFVFDGENRIKLVGFKH